jgi:hypothetical protein
MRKGPPIKRSEQNARRKIVSKEEYLTRVARREAKRWGATAMAFAVGGCFVCSLLSLGGMALADGMVWKGLFLLGVVVPFSVGVMVMKVAEKTMQEAQMKLDVVPLTRANAGALQAPEVLVRASQEPLEAQRTELLRPAAQGAETPATELLRASTTGSET